jgi:hypothetical protein
MAFGIAAWQLAFEITPILLKGGIVSKVWPGGTLPILLATEAINFPLGIMSAGNMPSLDDAFAHFQPAQGAVVIDQAIASYPFANQAVAANSLISQPLRVSMQMTCPVRGPLAYWRKLAQMELLIQALKFHNFSGGLYHILTPSYVYTNCVMRSMRDISSAGTKQVQTMWMLDFESPLLTLEDATGAEQVLNNILDTITNGGQQNGMPQTSSIPTSTATTNPPAALATGLGPTGIGP